MTTAAASDRLVHHAVILEMTGKSIRVEHAQADQAAQGAITPTSTETTTTPTAATSTTSAGAPNDNYRRSSPHRHQARSLNDNYDDATDNHQPTKGANPTTTTPTKTKNRDHSTKAIDGEM